MTAGIGRIAVLSPFDGHEIDTVANMPPEAAQSLLQSATEGARLSRALSRHERSRVLDTCAGIVECDRAGFTDLIVAETGKTIRQATREVARCVNTLRLSADQARRGAGEVIPFDAFAGSENRQGWFTREPLGIVVAITPYNDPLNLAAHKLGPALAGGNAVILKPSEHAPLSALRLVACLLAAGLPPGIVSVATGGAALGEALVSAREVRMVSFTGGFATGEKIARAAGLKKLAMDLGGNAPVIVLGDCNLNDAVEACISGAFWAAGQNCIGTQRLLVHASVYDEFKRCFIQGTQQLKLGDPAHAETDVGPMISIDAAARAKAMVDDALRRGATLLCGHTLDGALYAPTVLESVSFDCELWQNEVFGPVVLLQKIDDVEQALKLANSPAYSLHAGIFTNDLHTALDAAQALEAGGVMINDSSDYRFDAMPFGGFKYGSLGREGVRFAYEEMTQPKVVCIRRPSQQQRRAP
jgi:acyl-CoA reductase-like NAD-dependent aldehyde dehydrogenase